HNNAKVVYVKSVPQSFKDGTTSVVEFYVEAEDGSRTLTYKVNVTRAMASTENKLSDLVLTVNNEKILGKTNALNTFSEDVFTYNITLNENYTNALITYVKKVSSQEVSGPVNLQQTLKHGNNQFIIVVTPEDKEGLKGTYTINITIKNSDIELTNLSIDGLTFNYDSNTDTYDLGTVDGRFENINIAGTLS